MTNKPYPRPSTQFASTLQYDYLIIIEASHQGRGRIILICFPSGFPMTCPACAGRHKGLCLLTLSGGWSLCSGASCLVPRATHCHVMTCNDDDITITTGTRLHASMQILSIQRTAMHTTLCTPQHNTGGGSRSKLVVSKGSRDPYLYL